MFVSSLQYLQTSFHLHRFLKSTVEKKIKIMFSFQCLSCVCLLGFTHTFPAPYYLVWYFSKQALVQVSPFTKSKKLYIMVKIISPARGCLSIDLEYSHLDFSLSCGKKSPPPCMSGSTALSLFPFKLVSYQMTGNGISEVQHGRSLD